MLLIVLCLLYGPIALSMDRREKYINKNETPDSPSSFVDIGCMVVSALIFYYVGKNIGFRKEVSVIATEVTHYVPSIRE